MSISDTPSRRLVVTRVDSNYNRVTMTREEIRLKISNDCSKELASRLFLACLTALPIESLQTYRGQVGATRDEAHSMQMYTACKCKAFRFYF